MSAPTTTSLSDLLDRLVAAGAPAVTDRRFDPRYDRGQLPAPNFDTSPLCRMSATGEHHREDPDPYVPFMFCDACGFAVGDRLDYFPEGA